MTTTTIQNATDRFELIAWLRTRRHVCCVRCGVLFDLTGHHEGCIDFGCDGCVATVSAQPVGFLCPDCE